MTASLFRQPKNTRMEVKVKHKKCKFCKELFMLYRSTQQVCSAECAERLVRINQKRRSRREAREHKEKLKTRSEWIKEAQAACNAFIRERDKNEPCISCGRYHQGQYHAGHYRTTKAAPQLRFHPLNIFRQCAPCNTHLSGNITEYRIAIVKKIGLANVEWLENNNTQYKYTIEDAKEIKQYFRERLKELKNEIITESNPD